MGKTAARDIRCRYHGGVNQTAINSRPITNSTLDVPCTKRTRSPAIPNLNIMTRHPQCLTSTFHTRIP
ncbi:hypothetical protein BJ165DRAFT_1492921 [Panaeolus papilionaceus]|nr:hypothetical protein BJ165DRAFT_1492921 [Panaeolus papilionaceus]